MANGGNVGSKFIDPSEIGVVPQAGLLGVDPGPHGRAGRCADRNRAVLPIETYSLSLETLHGWELNVRRDVHVCIPLIHAQNEDVGMAGSAGAAHRSVRILILLLRLHGCLPFWFKAPVLRAVGSK